MSLDIHKTVTSLPTTGKKIFLKGYQKSIDLGIPKEQALDNGLFAVSNMYKHVGGSWVHKQNVELNTVILKEGGLFNKQHFFNATLSSSNIDDQGQYVDEKLLKTLSSKNLIDSMGDIFHLAAKGVVSWKGLFKKTEHSMEDGKLKLRFTVDKNHEHYNEFKKLSKTHKFNKLSAEFYNPVLKGPKIVGASGLGWTLLDNGSNPDAKIE